MNLKIKLLLSIMMTIMLVSCMPNTSDVEADFLKYKPDAQVISIKTGEGDSDSVYFYITYKTKMNLLKKVDVLLYQVDKKNKWILTKHWEGNIM
jgi:hypothetical protein